MKLFWWCVPAWGSLNYFSVKIQNFYMQYLTSSFVLFKTIFSETVGQLIYMVHAHLVFPCLAQKQSLVSLPGSALSSPSAGDTGTRGC